MQETVDQFIVTERGGPEVLRMQQAEMPKPGPGQVRLRALAAGVAFGDLLWMSGVVPGSPAVPYTPGYDLVGVVDALGAGVVGLERGQRVAALVQTGGYAQYSVWPAEKLALLPDDQDVIQQAVLPLNYITAYHFLMRVKPVHGYSQVLVHGASGGFGTAVLDVCRWLGVRAFGTASAAKHDLVESYGGIAIDYKNEDFVQIADNAGGMDLVIDHIGGWHLLRSFKALRKDGMLISTSSYASAMGVMGSLESLAGFAMLPLLNVLPNGRNAGLQNITDFYARNPGMFNADLQVLHKALGNGYLSPAIDRVFPFDEAVQALQYLKDDKARGKVLLQMP